MSPAGRATLRARGAGFLTVREAAERLRVCTATIYKLCQRGELEHIRVSNAIRILPVALEAFGKARVLSGIGITQPRSSSAPDHR